MIYWSLISLFLIATVIQLGYLTFLRLPRQKQKPPVPLSVSIIICAKNEAGHLQQFLPFVLQQDYPEASWEVIVVNDGSTDGTNEILSAFSRQYPQLKIISIDPETVKDIPGKKYALAKGIAGARFDRLLLTDADCKPSSNLWLRQMTLQEKEIVLGYGAYETQPGLLNRFIRWETVHTCMQYTGYAAAGKPYMGVGRNLCYNRSLLTSLETDEIFRKTYGSTPSGDDDLLIGKIATSRNTQAYLAPEAHTISVAQKTWKDWWRQKTRHVSTGKYYHPAIKALLGLYGLSHSLYWLLGLPLCGYALWHSGLAGAQLLVVPFLLRLILYWFNTAGWYRQLGEKKLFLFYPLGDLGWAFYNVFLSPYILWKNKKAWK